MDLDKPLNDSEANRLRNQILALKNVIVQFGGGGLFDRVVVSANERLLRHLERHFDSQLNLIDLDKPLADFRLNQLRNQVLTLENLMNQLDCSNQADIPLLSLMRIEHMKRMGELLQKVALS